MTGTNKVDILGSRGVEGDDSPAEGGHITTIKGGGGHPLFRKGDRKVLDKVREEGADENIDSQDTSRERHTP